MEDRQTVTIKYSAVNKDGIETVGGEMRLGLMKLEDVKEIEKAIIQFQASLQK